jgi:hypothetical protein
MCIGVIAVTTFDLGDHTEMICVHAHSFIRGAPDISRFSRWREGRQEVSNLWGCLWLRSMVDNNISLSGKESMVEGM